PSLARVAAASEGPRPENPSRASALDSFWDGTAQRNKRAVETFAPLARRQADEHGRVTPDLQAALTRIESAHANTFTRGARREWQNLVASLGAQTTLPIVTPPVAVPYWQKGAHPLANFQSRPNLPEEADVVIVGAGLTGAAAAYRLAEAAQAKGLKVVVLDGGDPAGQASGRNGGNFELIPENYKGDYEGLAAERARLSKPLHPGATAAELRELGERQARAILRLAARNREVLLDIVRRENIQADVTPAGWVRAAVNATEDKGLAAEVALVRSLGLDMRALTPRELDEAMGVAPGTNKFGGRLSESDGNYHPFKYVNGALQAALAKGAELYTRTEVRRLTELGNGEHLVETERGNIRAKQVILASGAFTAKLVPGLDIKLYRSQVQVTEHVQDRWKGRTVTADQGDLYGHFPQGESYTKMDGVKRAPLLLGGGRDKPTRAARSRDIMRSHAISKRLLSRRDGMFPELKGVPPSREWAGPLDYAPDQLPGIGLLRPGLIVAAGFSGYGGTYTQAAGEAAAIIALTGKAPEWLPQDIFSPRRFLKPGGAPALKNDPAPLDGPTRPADASPDEPSRSINSFWSGFDDYEGESSLQTLGAADESDAGSAAPWLVLKDRKLAAALDAAVTLARTTDAGRRALDAAEKALTSEGRTLSIEVKDLGRNWGEYDYLDGRMRLHRRLFEKGREAELAGTLAHELLHVAQHAAGLPSNALELEIEAHLQDLALMNELGLRTPPNTFARQTEEALKKGPAAFIALIQMAVPGSPFLGESSFADIVDQLEQDLESAEGHRGPRAGKYADAIARDMKSLRSKKGRAAYKAFSQRVLELLKSRASQAGA
ncbi:MAG: NAD(P)/FAD-dependent oxidoreductase, partial [Elusimicrobiota bacterium]